MACAVWLNAAAENYPYRSDWLAFLMAGAVLQIYTSFMIPYQMKKDLAAGKSENKPAKKK